MMQLVILKISNYISKKYAKYSIKLSYLNYINHEHDNMLFNFPNNVVVF